MRELINDLLAFSRTNVVDRKYVNTDLNKVIENVKDALKENIKEQKAVIVTDLHGDIKIIPFLFVQLMENLINNSLKFCKKEVPINIEIKSRIVTGTEIQNEKLLPAENYCHISFKDNGIGFEPEHCEKIFGVFQRLHGRELYDGTGIGLAIVKKIVENHNGIISATSAPMEGATFNIYIPN
jgi:signal transduction histidine kinase